MNDNMSQDSRKNPTAIVVTLIVVSVAGYLLFPLVKKLLTNPPPAGVDINAKQSVFPEDVLEKLWKRKNLGIALLENEQFEKSAVEFREISLLAASEPLGYQNLSVATLMRIESEASKLSPDELAALSKQAELAIAQLQKNDPDSAISYIFSARLAGIKKKNEIRVSKLTEAIARDNKDPSLLYALYEASSQLHDPAQQVKSAAPETLLKAHQLAPENLFLLTELLLVQSQEKDIAIKQSLSETRHIIEPFLASIKKMTRLDADTLIEKTIALLDAEKEAVQWKQITRNVRILVNVLKPEDVMQSDRRRIAKNMLEYIRFQFSDSLQNQYEKLKPVEQESVSISFSKPAKDNQLPDSSSIQFFQLGDFNLDGKTDIVILTEKEIDVWSHDDANSKWNRLTRFPLKAPASSFLLVDLDSDVEKTNNVITPEKTIDPRLQTGPQFDADLDVILISDDGITLLENIREPKSDKRSLVPVDKSSSLKAFASTKKILPIDFDHDGDLDLCIATNKNLSLWKQLSPFEYQQVSDESAFAKSDINVHSLVAVDWDHDVDLDIVVGTAQGNSLGILENMKHGRFRWQTLQVEKLATGTITDLHVLDFDGNASWDLLLAGEAGLQKVTTQTTPGGNVTLSAAVQISKTPTEGVYLADFDNNGWLDIFSHQATDQKVWLADSRGTFSKQIPVDLADADTVLLGDSADLDGDGDLDLCLLSANANSDQQAGGSIQILRNQGGNKNNWLEVVLRAEQIKGNQRAASGRVNHYGIGSLLELKAEGLYQPRVITSQKTHFGLGKYSQADAIRILWTNGIPVNIIEPATNICLYEKQTLKGSCPYLYAWNGKRYNFVTDLLWAAPLGLITPTGAIAPHREWEYLLVTGDQLKPHAGTYDIQITEELWEAAYFDTIQLIAIDHPADVQIFSNEKVGPAQISSFEIHTVQNARQPISVVNQYNDDLLELVSRRDEQYAKSFHKKYLQGIVENHYLEIDLGKLEDPRSIKLFLTGWLLPSDTSINASIAQNKTKLPPAPLSLSVLNAKGKWEKVIPFTGFPGGKTKTIVLDLSKVFLTKDYRLRLSSEQELYWDHVFFTVNENGVDFTQSKCKLNYADLHYRGYSEIIQHPQFGPELYNYNKVKQAPKWPPMQGCFTKFGDVRELIRSKDERLVILGAGDELSLRFQVPEKALPAGWRRDFILYNVGWDKDADLNTVYGQSVDPLPFYRMSRYPFITEDDFRNAAVHRRDEIEYHNRRQSRSGFWKALMNQSAH